jgi:hypothetical protein
MVGRSGRTWGVCTICDCACHGGRSISIRGNRLLNHFVWLFFLFRLSPFYAGCLHLHFPRQRLRPRNLCSPRLSVAIALAHCVKLFSILGLLICPTPRRPASAPWVLRQEPRAPRKTQSVPNNDPMLIGIQALQRPSLLGRDHPPDFQRHYDLISGAQGNLVLRLRMVQEGIDWGLQSIANPHISICILTTL